MSPQSANERQWPEAGKHYEAWFKSEDGKNIRNLGQVQFSATGSGRLEVNEPDAKNFLGLFNQTQCALTIDTESMRRLWLDS